MFLALCSPCELSFLFLIQAFFSVFSLCTLCSLCEQVFYVFGSVFLCELALMFFNPHYSLRLLRPPCSLCGISFVFNPAFFSVFSAPSVRTSFYVFGSVFSVRTEFLF